MGVAAGVHRRQHPSGHGLRHGNRSHARTRQSPLRGRLPPRRSLSVERRGLKPEQAAPAW
jgi:hypothetical protein